MASSKNTFASKPSVYNVLIIIDCDAIVAGNRDGNQVIQMFADPAIVMNDSNNRSTQGTCELSIKVNNQDLIRWYLIPKTAQSSDIDGGYSPIVSSDYAWNGATLLANWTAYNGQTDLPIYDTPGGSLPLSSSDGNPTKIKVVGDYQPYVQAQAVLPGRPDPGFSQEEAYSFYVDIYQGTQKKTTYSWDPHVTIVQP